MAYITLFCENPSFNIQHYLHNHRIHATKKAENFYCIRLPKQQLTKKFLTNLLIAVMLSKHPMLYDLPETQTVLLKHIPISFKKIIKKQLNIFFAWPNQLRKQKTLHLDGLIQFQLQKHQHFLFYLAEQMIFSSLYRIQQ